MRIKNSLGKWIEVGRKNYEEHIGATVCDLGEGTMCIKTDNPSAKDMLKTQVVGHDDVYSYYYFTTDLSRSKNGTAHVIDGYKYVIMLKGEAPIDIDETVSEGLPLFSMTMLEGDRNNEIEGGSNSEMDYNLIAAEYFGAYSYAKYNEEYYYFNTIRQRWQILRSYDDYNILISQKNRNYIQKDKRQIMDSMQIYLSELESKTLNRNLLLFQNNKVFNIMSGEVTDFDGSQFILNSLNANWHENINDIPEQSYYLKKVLNDLTGVNIYKTEVEDKRYEDLLIYLGYILTDMQKQSGLMMFGKSQNGKSTLAALITHIKGSGFKPAIAPLLSDAHYTSGFYNDRVLFFDELKPVEVTDKFISIFNQLLGDDEQSIRELNKAPRTVRTNFTAIITVNEISHQFVTYRALLRRTKIMNSTFPVVTNLPPSLNLNDELRKQDNLDWLANTAIRKFIKNDYRIDNLFVSDMAEWIYKLNPTAKKYLDMLRLEGYINEAFELIVEEHIFKTEHSQQEMLHKQLAYSGDLTVFDEQINIALQFVLGINDMTSVGGNITWR